MTTIKCPICKEKISGMSTADLNSNLRDHFSDTHEMRELTMASAGGVSRGAPVEERGYYVERPAARTVERRTGVTGEYYPSQAGREYNVRGSDRTYRDVETWNAREPYHSGTPEQKRMVEQVTRWQDVEPRHIDTGREPERRERYFERERTEENPMVSCPFCGNLIRGRDEDDLSDELRDHMADIHHVRPKMTARLMR